jgi:hypothetical protein
MDIISSLGFIEVNYVSAFQEYEYSYDLVANRETVDTYACANCIQPYPLESEDE